MTLRQLLFLPLGMVSFSLILISCFGLINSAEDWNPHYPLLGPFMIEHHNDFVPYYPFGLILGAVSWIICFHLGAKDAPSSER